MFVIERNLTVQEKIKFTINKINNENHDLTNKSIAILNQKLDENKYFIYKYRPYVETYYFYAIDITECYNINGNNELFDKYLKDNKLVTYRTNQDKILINLAETNSNINKKPNKFCSYISFIVYSWILTYGVYNTLILIKNWIW